MVQLVVCSFLLRFATWKMGLCVNPKTKLQYYPPPPPQKKKSMEYYLEMLIFFTDLIPLEIVIKKIYMHIYIFIYIGYLFVKHDLALICVDTGRRKKQGKLEERERIKGHIPPTQRSPRTWTSTTVHTQTHTLTHTYAMAFNCDHWRRCVRLRQGKGGIFWKNDRWVCCGAMKLRALLFVPREITFILDAD